MLISRIWRIVSMFQLNLLSWETIKLRCEICDEISPLTDQSYFRKMTWRGASHYWNSALNITAKANWQSSVAQADVQKFPEFVVNITPSTPYFIIWQINNFLNNRWSGQKKFFIFSVFCIVPNLTWGKV